YDVANGVLVNFMEYEKPIVGSFYRVAKLATQNDRVLTVIAVAIGYGTLCSTIAGIHTVLLSISATIARRSRSRQYLSNIRTAGGILMGFWILIEAYLALTYYDLVSASRISFYVAALLASS